MLGKAPVLGTHQFLLPMSVEFCFGTVIITSLQTETSSNKYVCIYFTFRQNFCSLNTTCTHDSVFKHTNNDIAGTAINACSEHTLDTESILQRILLNQLSCHW
jgi:hypothetical protein